MEYCGHCRTIRKTRQSSRTRTVKEGGVTRTVKVKSFHCAFCGHFIRSDEPLAPVHAPAPAAAAPAAATESSEPTSN